MGQTDMHLVDDRAPTLPEWDEAEPVAVLTQTTLSVDDTARSIARIQDRFSDVIVRNDLCYATTNRQAAVKDLARIVDVALVIGAQNSSNCNRLREVAEANGVPAYLINGPEEMDAAWFQNARTVGITSGASTPESLVMSVIDAIAPEDVTTIDGMDEDITFVLPREFRS